MDIDEIGSIITEALQTWGVIATDIELKEEGDGEWEAAVDIAGELLLDEVLDDHGTLLYNKEAEIHLRGFRGDRLLLHVRTGE